MGKYADAERKRIREARKKREAEKAGSKRKAPTPEYEERRPGYFGRRKR